MAQGPYPSLWVVEFHDDFEREFGELGEEVQDQLLAAAKALAIAGPMAGRPYVAVRSAFTSS